jgi:sigma-B regulation protein RsbU (phosphoserine phosphatase)
MKADKQTLQNRLKELEFLMESSRALNSTLDLGQLVRVIIKIVRDAVQAETVSVLFFDSKKENMVFEIAHGARDRELVGLKIPLGEGVAGWVAKNQRPRIINDFHTDKRYSTALERKLGLSHSIMSIPLKRRNEMIGVIEALNSRRTERFTKDDLKIFLTLGDHIATAVDNARLYREAERSRLENSQLYETGVALGMAMTLDEVLQQIIDSLKKIIPFDAAAIFVLDAKNQELVSHLQQGYPPGKESKLRLKLDEGLVGWAARHKEAVRVPDVSKDKRYIAANPRTRSEMVAPMLGRGKVIGLFNLESHRLDAYRARDLRLLTTFAAQAGVSIERARLYESDRLKREIDRELRIARTIQEFFTPSRSRRLGKYTLTGRNYPSLELSGDYHDAFPLRDPYVAFAIADVAGKGVPASIIMSSFRATLRTGAPYFTNAREIAARANDILLETVRPEDFVTAFIGVLDQKSGMVSYCNAGHEPAVLMKPDGRYELLETGGTVLGVFRNNKLQEGTFDMADNLLFAYTDGTTDAVNPKGDHYGLNRLIRFLKAHRDLPSVQICTELRKDLKSFMQGTPQADDLTFIALKKWSTEEAGSLA